MDTFKHRNEYDGNVILSEFSKFTFDSIECALLSSGLPVKTVFTTLSFFKFKLPMLSLVFTSTGSKLTILMITSFVLLLRTIEEAILFLIFSLLLSISR